MMSILKSVPKESKLYQIISQLEETIQKKYSSSSKSENSSESDSSNENATTSEDDLESKTQNLVQKKKITVTQIKRTKVFLSNSKYYNHYLCIFRRDYHQKLRKLILIEFGINKVNFIEKKTLIPLNESKVIITRKQMSFLNINKQGM